MPNCPCNCTSESPCRFSFPSKRSGVRVISRYLPLSRMFLCMRLSRAPLPLSPLVASMINSPVALPVARSMCISPRFILNVPCTVCNTSPRVNSTRVCPGSSCSTISCASAGSAFQTKISPSAGANRVICVLLTEACAKPGRGSPRRNRLRAVARRASPASGRKYPAGPRTRAGRAFATTASGPSGA